MTDDDGTSQFLESSIRPDELMEGQLQRTLNDAELLLKHENEFVQIACPACGSTRRGKAFVKFGLRHALCDECGTTYVSPRPRPEHLAEYYEKSEDWAYWSTHVFPASETARRDKVFIPRVRRLIDMCGRFGLRTGTIAEVGAGFGIFCDEIRKSGMFNRVIAIEPNPSLARNCRERGVETLEQPFDQVDIENGSLDVLAGYEAIEHLFDRMRDEYRAALSPAAAASGVDAGAAVELLWRIFENPDFAAVLELYTAARTDGELRSRLVPVADAHQAHVYRLAREYFPRADRDALDRVLRTILDAMQGMAVSRFVTGTLVDREARLGELKRLAAEAVGGERS